MTSLLNAVGTLEFYAGLMTGVAMTKVAKAWARQKFLGSTDMKAEETSDKSETDSKE